jgi:aminoglycoside N3'-acetyltransferase
LSPRNVARQVRDAIVTVLNKFKSKQRVRELEQTQRHVDAASLAGDLRGLGLREGDVLFLHSSLKSLGFVEGGPNTLFNALLDVIGPEGTLIVPTYYLPGGTIHATCQMKDYVFDPRVQGSNLGAVPEAFLKRHGVRRSIHPTHSVSAVGKHADYVTKDHHRAPSIFGKGSPWDRCHELNGKVLGLGISMGPVTFYHLLEDRVGDAFPLPVRMKPDILMPCRDWDGSGVQVPVVPLDPQFIPRRIDNKAREDVRQYFWEEFSRRGLLHTGTVGESMSWYIEAQAFYAHLELLMREGITIYATPEDMERRPIK